MKYDIAPKYHSIISWSSKLGGLSDYKAQVMKMWEIIDFREHILCKCRMTFDYRDS